MLPELLCNSDFLRTCELSIERIASYSDEEMQGFVNACEQLFLNTGQDILEQQDLVTILKIKLRETCKSLRMFSEAKLVGERGSKVSKKNAPNADGNMFTVCAYNKRRKFDSDNERLEVVLRLLASDVNSCRNDLASKAEAYCEQRFGNH
ncbi:hypothetical protein D5086_030049 [Populus alba]|uniref:Uncharacterized protein n=1 Tax=Populus alba TaxID=43335 RepID=A0ACC4AMG0_POPAL